MKNRVCKKCGHNVFSASQKSINGVIVDAENNVIEDMKNTYSAEAPYGPYECMKCGARYDFLKELDDDYIKPDGYISLEKIKEYIEHNGVICPNCGERDNMFTDKLEFSQSCSVKHYIKCEKCEYEWYDIYTLTSIHPA